MRALMCDLCRDFFERPKQMPKYKLSETSNTTSRYTKTYDLCPKCQEALGKWIEEKRKENKF